MGQMQNYGMVVAIRNLNTKVVQNYIVKNNVWAEPYRDENTGPFHWGGGVRLRIKERE